MTTTVQEQREYLLAILPNFRGHEWNFFSLWSLAALLADIPVVPAT